MERSSPKLRLALTTYWSRRVGHSCPLRSSTEESRRRPGAVPVQVNPDRVTEDPRLRERKASLDKSAPATDKCARGLEA